MQTGSCLCGGVTFQISGPMRPVIACHCTQCRKTSGHFWAATRVCTSDLMLTSATGLTWFQSSEQARRGFCARCGASLFWERNGTGMTSIGAGTLDGATGLSTDKHIYTADKGDYYSVDDALIPSDH